ncbi:UNVERIFIED_CONTAM: hypothetical protein NCL1_39528 [Trichonephila clavipes]
MSWLKLLKKEGRGSLESMVPAQDSSSSVTKFQNYLVIRRYYSLCFIVHVNKNQIKYTWMLLLEQNCPYTYFPLESENICIYMSSRPVALRDMESYCATEANGGRPFTRRFSDAGMKELSKTLKMSVESLFPPEVYIGIEREKDSMQLDTKYFAYTNNEGNVHQDDYPLWTDDPSRFDCGVASYLDDFKVKPFSCGNTAVFLCEKNEQRE